MDRDLELLHEKIDRLNEKFDFQVRQQQEMVELRQDLVPIANHFIRLSIEELAEIGESFQLEDLLFLLKRLLRSTRSLLGILEQVEGGIGLLEETNLLGKEVFNEVVQTLDRLEQDGYFRLIGSFGYLAGQTVHQVSPDQIRQLADRVGGIVHTIEKATRPGFLSQMDGILDGFQQEEEQEKPLSLFGILFALTKRETRMGLTRLLRVVDAIGASR